MHVGGGRIVINAEYPMSPLVPVLASLLGWYDFHSCQGCAGLKRALCLAEPCTVSEGDMKRNNVEVKWKYAGKVLHGDFIDFVCKEGFDLSPLTPLSALSVQCNRGQVEYPLCVRKGKTAVPSMVFQGVTVAPWVPSIRPKAICHHHL